MIVRIDLGVLEIDLSGTTVDQIDAELNVAMREHQRFAFETVCERNEAVGLAERACECGGEMTVKDSRVRTVSTLGGEASVRIRRLRCTLCGAQRRPLDPFLPPGRRHTLAVVEAGLHLATDMSYVKSSATLSKLAGAQISHGQLQRPAKAEGALVDAELHAATEDLYGLGLDPGELVSRTRDDMLVIAIDGGMIPDRATGGHMEAKVAVLYGLQAPRDELAASRSARHAQAEDAQVQRHLGRQLGFTAGGGVKPLGSRCFPGVVDRPCDAADRGPVTR